jgi:hypothetical protein
MSLHKVYCNVCNVCNDIVTVGLAGKPHDFMSWFIECPCEKKEEVVIKQVLNGYGLFNICNLEVPNNIQQNILEYCRSTGNYF